MATALITHGDCLGHATPDGHPEQAARLREVLKALETERFQDLIRVDAPLADDAAILRAHDQAHLDQLHAALPKEGRPVHAIDSDTFISHGSLQAARRAAGAVIEAVDIVLSGYAGNAFCAVRPPGHHAERVGAMGFCLFNNVGVGAHHAMAAHGLSRIAVIDFDVHHGNGAQDIFWNDPRVLVASSHEWPLYPGTGAEEETGVSDNILNVHLSAGAGSTEFRERFEAMILPRVEAHAPELVFISAGFDAHAADPLSTVMLTERDFAWATKALCALAGRVAGGRVVSSLEGGYELTSLSRSVAAHVEVLTDFGLVRA